MQTNNKSAGFRIVIRAHASYALPHLSNILDIRKLRALQNSMYIIYGRYGFGRMLRSGEDGDLSRDLSPESYSSTTSLAAKVAQSTHVCAMIEGICCSVTSAGFSW